MSLSVAQIGCGHWGRNLARNFHELGALAAVVDGDAETAKTHSERYAVRAMSFVDVLSDPSIGAVSLATPAVTHADLAQQAFAAGKHVYVEKPLALNEADALAVIEAAKHAGRTLMVGHLLHYHPLFQALKQEIAAGRLGKIRRISSARMSLGKFRTEENVLWSFAPHDIAMVLSLAGSEPHHVDASGQVILTSGIADHAELRLAFGDGLMADITVSWLHPFKYQRLTVIGDRGMAVFDDSEPEWDRKLAIYDHRIDTSGPVPLPNKAEPDFLKVSKAQPLLLECRHFLDCVAEQRQPVSDGAEGLAVLRVLSAAQSSMDKKQPGQSQEVFVHPTSLVDDGAKIGAGCKIWHFSHILKNTELGDDCTVGQNAMIGPDVRIGKGCKIQNNVSLYKGVTLADGVFCGPSCVFTNVNTPRATIERKDEFAKTRVGEGATIGANATIVCGHDIGAYALIGAGAVVVDHVPPFALMVGNPARQIGWVGHAGERLVETDDGFLRCPRTAKLYRLGEYGPTEVL